MWVVKILYNAVLLFSSHLALGSETFQFIGPDHLNSVGKPQTKIVSTKYGELRGFMTSLPNETLSPVEVYLGVPYASPPTSALRFMPPVTPAIWRGVINCAHFKPVCPQKLPEIKNETQALKTMTLNRLEYLKKLLPFLENQSEDCLHLNIYAPVKEHRGRSLIPVLVFIHGESFEWNAGNPYDGSVLASYGKILVITVNFRLGVLGFLPIIEGSARGNYGITDLIAALHWIQENIAQFGGDPKNVTLLGQGHGAALVHFLVLSPMTKGSALFPLGLFHRAIMLSGSALSPWAVAREANQYAQKLSITLECPINDPAITLECLRQRSVSDILGVEIKVPTFLSGFGPTIDGIVIQGEPEVLLETQNEEYPFDSIEVMFGISKSTSYFQVSQQEESEGFSIGRRDKLLRTLVRNIFSYHLQEIFLTIVNEYTDWSKTPQHNVNILESTLDALGDALFVAPVIRAANYHSLGQSGVYFYVFNYQTEGEKHPDKQRCICEDLEYIFGSPLIGYPGYFNHMTKNFSENERIFSEAVMSYLINFLKSGNPNSLKVEKMKEKHRNKVDKSWPVYDNVHQKYMMLGIKQKVRDHYHAHRLSYWLNLFPRLHRTRSENINLEHSFLLDHDNPMSYEGPVRQIPVNLPRIVSNTTTSPKTVTLKNDTVKETPKAKTVTTVQVNYQLPTKEVNATDSHGSNSFSERYSMVFHATVGAGIILLLLNILIFAGIYYQRVERKANAALRKRDSMQTSFQELQVHQSVITHKKAVTFRDPPSSLMYQTGNISIPPPSHYKHPHKVHLKPCTIPTPPELCQK